MPTPGYVFRDGQAIPDSELHPDSSKSQQEKGAKATGIAGIQTQSTTTERAKTSPTAHTLVPPTTDSHALAAADHEVKGVAQRDHDASNVKDTGWRQNAEGVSTLVGGLPNDELWTLVRRFNKARCQPPKCLSQY